MTSMIATTEVLKQDTRGRVRVPAERRDALLEEFDKSGMSAAKFASLAGIKYATFANWVQKRRKERAALMAEANAPGSSPVTGGPVRLFEAQVDGGCGGARRSGGSHGLLVELPGGSRMIIESPIQFQMAAELLVLIARGIRARC
jgi:hypothetical protein